MYLPVAVSGNNVVNPQLLADLLHAQVGDICIELLGSHGRGDGRRQVHQASGLVVGGITPPVPLAPLLRAVGVELRLTALRTATALAIRCRRRHRAVLSAIIGADAPTTSEWDGVRTRGSWVVSPRHVCDVLLLLVGVVVEGEEKSHTNWDRGSKSSRGRITARASGLGATRRHVTHGACLRLTR